MSVDTSGSLIRYRPDPEGTHPPLDYPDYRSTQLRAPSRPFVPMRQSLTELTSPVFGDGRVRAVDADLTRQHDDEPQGERIIVYGQVSRRTAGPFPTPSSRSGRPTPRAATATPATSTPRLWTRTSPAAGAA